MGDDGWLFGGWAEMVQYFGFTTEVSSGLCFFCFGI